MRTRRAKGVGVSVLLLGGFIACGVSAGAVKLPYVRKATWHETMLASRRAMAAAKGAPAAPVGLAPLDKGRWTVMAWVRTTRGGTIFCKAPADGSWAAGGKSLFIGGGRACYDIGWVGCTKSGPRIADGKWHHVALVGGGGRQEIYVDGKPAARSSLATSRDVKGHVMKIGFTSTNFGGAFIGEIDEVRFYGRLLSADDIKACFAKPASATTAGLQGRWAFDGDCLDSSGRNNHPTKTVKVAFAAGKIGKALKLTGRGYVVLPSAGQVVDQHGPLWARLSRDFADAASRQEITWERDDGIWAGKVRPGDWASLAGRYAAAVRGAERAEAAKLAAKAADKAALAKVRDMYLTSRRREEVLARLSEFDLAGLRKMIGQLAAKAPALKKHLSRLDVLEQQAAGWAAGRIDPDALEQWKKDLRKLRHDALVTANPLMDFDRLVFVKRFKYQSNHYYTDYINGCRKFGGGLCVLDLKTGRVTDLAPSMNEGIFGRYDLSFDARRIVFAWKKSLGEGFRIYEVGTDGARTAKAFAS